jgi:hypothetical protein
MKGNQGILKKAIKAALKESGNAAAKREVLKNNPNASSYFNQRRPTLYGGKHLR